MAKIRLYQNSLIYSEFWPSGPANPWISRVFLFWNSGHLTQMAKIPSLTVAACM